MSHIEIILEYLEGAYPKQICDDCLSENLNIKPRQQVNQICRKLEKNKKLERKREQPCDFCLCNKITNSVMGSILINAINPKNHEKPNFEVKFNIGESRTEIVRICRHLWEKCKNPLPVPFSISQTINILKREGYLPCHQANMMLTICGIRNVIEYEDYHYGEREIVIAENAWSIIKEWYAKKGEKC